MTDRILLNEEARKGLKLGIDEVAEPVKRSLGAQGKNSIVNGKSTKDGFSIAKGIQFSDPLKSIGTEMIKAVSRKTVNEAGDGTSSSTLLAQAIVTEGFKLLSAGYKGSELKRGVDKATSAVVENLKLISHKVEIDSPKLLQIATISGNNDSSIGEMVFNAIQKTGKDGVVTLEDSRTGETYLELKQGLVFERGYLSTLFINNFEKLTCVLDNPYILLCDGKVSTLKQIAEILKEVGKEAKPIVIIAEDFEGEALFTINTNRLKGNFPICLIKTPGFGDNQKDVLKDISAVVNANIVSDETGLRLDTLKISDLGTCDKVTVSKDETQIIGGGGAKQDIEERIRFVRKSLEICDVNDFYGKKLLEERLAKLTGGIGIIYVGAPTETELSELKDRYDDALKATLCAADEGVLVGGGVALIRCIEKLNDLKGDTEDEQAGINLVKKVLESPFTQMAKNADLENKITVGEVLKSEGNFGYNFKTDKWEDLMESGVIDPLKVVRVALINAASFGGTLLTTDCVVVPEKEEQKQFIPPQMR